MIDTLQITSNVIKNNPKIKSVSDIFFDGNKFSYRFTTEFDNNYSIYETKEFSEMLKYLTPDLLHLYVITPTMYNNVDDFKGRQQTFKKLFPKGESIVNILKEMSSKEENGDNPMFRIVYDNFVHNNFITDEIIESFCKIKHRWHLIDIASNIHCSRLHLEQLVDAELDCGEEYDLLRMSELPSIPEDLKEKLKSVANSKKHREYEIDAVILSLHVDFNRSYIKIQTSDCSLEIGLKDDEQARQIIQYVGSSKKLKIIQSIWSKHSFDRYTIDSGATLEQIQ